MTDVSAADRPEVAPYDELSEDDVIDLQVENAALRAVVQRAVEELDAEHREGKWTIAGRYCESCGADWPCPSKQVADELRQALGEQ